MCVKPGMFVAPYDSEEQRAMRSLAFREAEHRRRVWDREDALRYYTAGGGNVEDSTAAWERRLEEVDRKAVAFRESSFHTAGDVV
jgi:hypothetical protein